MRDAASSSVEPEPGVEPNSPASNQSDAKAAPARPSATLGRLDVARAMRIWIYEAAVSSANGAIINGTFQTGYVLFLGANSFILGVTAAIPPLVNVLQLVSSYVAHLIGSRRRIVSIASVTSRLLWLPILLIPFVLPHAAWIPAYLILSFISSALMAVSGPVWMDWMTDIVPADKRGRYFGIRNVYGGLTAMIVSVGGGVFLDTMTKSHGWSQAQAFAVLFGTACIFAVLAFACASSSPDIPEEARQRPDQLSWRHAAESYIAPLKDLPYRKVILLSLAVIGVQTFAGNFFTAYQLEYLRFSYSAVQTLGIASSVSTLAAMPVLGYLADKFGNKPIMILSALMVIPIPILWCMTTPDSFPGLYAIQPGGGVVVSGSKMIVIVINIVASIGWAGVGLGQFNLQIGAAPREQRGAYLAAGMALGGIVGGISPLIGGFLMQAMSHLSFPDHGLVRSNYHALFILSALSRILILFAAIGITEKDSRSARYVLGKLKTTNPLGAATAIQKLSRGGDSDARRKAAVELGRLKAPIAVEELVRALDDTALPVREKAAEALGEIGDERAVRPLLRKLTDPASGITSEAAAALGKIGDSAALPELVAIAADENGVILRRAAAVEAIGQLPQPEALDALVGFIESDMRSVRSAALRALADRSDLFGNATLANVLTRQWEAEEEESNLPLLADAMSQLGDPAPAVLIANSLDRSESPVTLRELLNAVGSMLAGRDSFYPYLALDRFAADETVFKILTNLQRQLKPNRQSPNAGLAARFIVRLRQALGSYASGDVAGCALRLDQAARLAVPLPARRSPATPDLDDICLEITASLRNRAAEGRSGQEELLLMLFIVRLLVNG